MMWPRILGLATILLVPFACGSEDAPAATDPGADASAARADGAPPGSGDASPAADGTVSSDAPVVTPARFKEMRGVLHVHSAYSHDACDGKGLEGNVPNAPCIAELRAAPCKVGLDFVMLTDHPANMKDFTPAENLLYDATKGDVLVMDAAGTSPVASMVSCPNGRKVMFTFGYEGTHTLPMGFAKHPTQYDRYADDRPLADVKALVDDLKAAGALVGLAHSEQDDLSADRIVEGGAEVMEWYNPHGNFLTALGGDTLGGNALSLLSFLGGLDPFLAGSTSGAHADLVYLQLLPSWPKAGFEKWRTVQRKRHVPGVLGSDVHQNISVDPVCSGATQVICAAAAAGKSSALALLISGGQLVLSDNRRLDAYERIMRWLQNRVLTNDITPEGVMGAMRVGRSYGLFSVFGDPTGFSFVGEAGGKPLDMGDVSSGPMKLTVTMPPAPIPLAEGPQFDAASAKNAELRIVLLKTDAAGTTEVKTGSGLGTVLTYDATAPAAYHLEVWIKPKHLIGVLGPEAARANTEYLWFLTNPIRLGT